MYIHVCTCSARHILTANRCAPAKVLVANIDVEDKATNINVELSNQSARDLFKNSTDGQYIERTSNLQMAKSSSYSLFE